jgi:hypothetical protein
MSRIKGLKLSPVREAELAFVVQELGSLSWICDRCKCKLDAFADKCVADLGDCCPGYLAIENAKAKFHRLRKEREWDKES